MSKHKLQFWMRPDQRECLVRCLKHVRGEFDNELIAPRNVERLALNVARAYVNDLLAIFDPEPPK